ncbi:transposase, partial [Romeriopsis navalis]
MRCPRCESDQLYKNGVRQLKDGTPVQYYQCRVCEKRFNERAGTPMSRLRSSVDEVSMALK